MTPPVPRRAALLGLVLSGLLLGSPRPAPARAEGPARQVTVFGIIATPNNPAIDPKLDSIAAQLRNLLPNHGFRLLDVQSRRLVAGQMVTCHLGGGYTAATTLVQPVDDNGKVVLRCELLLNEVSRRATLVATPLNQLFFWDRMLEDGSRLLIGVGVR